MRFYPATMLRRFGTTTVCACWLLCCLIMLSSPRANEPIRTHPLQTSAADQPSIIENEINYNFVRTEEDDKRPSSANRKSPSYMQEDSQFLEDRHRLTEIKITASKNERPPTLEEQEDNPADGLEWERIPHMDVLPGSPYDDDKKETGGDKKKFHQIQDLAAKVFFGLDEETKDQEENAKSCNGRTVMPSGAFCLHKNRVLINDNKIWDGLLCRGLEDLFGKTSVLDLGAGLGHYGRCFYRARDNVIDARDPNESEYMWHNYWYEMGIGGLREKKKVIKSWIGYDGAQNIAWVSGDFVKQLDLSEPINLSRKYDWVMSLEVGEHLPKEFEDVFLDNVVKTACKGIVLSWSHETSDDHHHVNPRPNDYIIDRMRERGLLHDQHSQDILRNTLRLEHFKTSMMVFRVPEEKRC